MTGTSEDHSQMDRAEDPRPCEDGRNGKTEAEDGRRRFISRILAAAAAVPALVFGLPIVGFLFSAVRRREEPVWRSVGAVTAFPLGATIQVNYAQPDPLPWAGFTVRNAAWVRREAEDRMVAFSMYCTHTGCPVAWVPDAGLFLCPCHGGAFHSDGSVAAGPPPRPLERQPIRIRNGQVEIQTMGLPTP